MDNQIKIEDWKQKLVTILPLEHATLEVHNILFEFIDTLLKSQRESRDKELREKIEKFHQGEITELLNSNNKDETKEHIKKGLEVYKNNFYPSSKKILKIK